MTRSPGSLRGWIALAARGFAMGAADVVPGVSGGTMAFILGIYEPLVDATRRLSDPAFWRLVAARDLRAALRYVSATFLLTVLAGLLAAIFTLAPALSWALRTHPDLLWAFFFGLVLASIYTVGKRLPQWTFGTGLLAVVGGVAAWILVGLVPVSTPDAGWFLVLSGAIAICAMMLPGISGSFLLVILGKYQVAIEAVIARDLATLALFALGAGAGLLAFARVLSWLLRHFHDLTVAALIGLMAGSLRKVWPWKLTVATRLDRHGVEVPLVQQNVLPSLDAATVLAIALAVVGLTLILVLARVEATRVARAHASGAAPSP